MEDFRYWLLEHKTWMHCKRNLEEDDLQKLLSDVDQGLVGLGRPGVFNLTYSFTAQVEPYY